MVLTTMRKVTINKITDNIINKFKSLYPFNISENDGQYKIEVGRNNREIWAFPLVGGSEYIDLAIHSLEEHRKVIPAALNRCAQKIDGIFLVGYYIKRNKNDDFEHGLIIIPANRDSKQANSELLTNYCFEREDLYKRMMTESYFHQIQLFLQSYCSICKKYWIQDTKLINTSFVERPFEGINNEPVSQAATSTWKTEVYQDFMRPLSMIGDTYIDFMLCDHNLVSLQTEIEEDDSIWDLFEEEGIKNIYNMPSSLFSNNEDIGIKDWCETTSYELSMRKDFDYKTLYDISVPGLKGNIINQGYSIGWCGKVAFMGISLDKPLYVSPTLLREISEIGDFEQVGNDNKALWRNRDIDYRKHFGVHNLVKVSDILITEEEARRKLLEACKTALQSCKKPLKEIQKGLNKYVIRYLKALSRSLEEKKASELLNQLNLAQICADEQEVLYKIIDWTGEN